MRRTGAKRLSLFHRLGIILVILGMMQSLAPTCFRPTRSSLRVLGRLRIALATLELSDLSAYLPGTLASLAPEAGQEQEPDQESHDTENLAESLAWPEAMTVRRSVQRSAAGSLLGVIPHPRRGAGRTLLAPRSMRALPTHASSSSMTTRLCRFTC